MSDKKRKVPKLRFPGFTDEWEQRKVGDLASNIYGGGTPATSNEGFWSGTIPWIQSSDLTANQVFGVHPRKYITKAAVMNSATKIVPENSLAIITRVGVGKLAIMPFSYTTSQDFLSLSDLKTDVQFTAYLLYKRLQGELNSVQGTSIKGITKDELLKKIIYVPERREQEELGAFFRNLDNLITLHQRKSENLQKLKKGLLQKMFPKNKECVPELRFPGFTDNWEQHKLSKIATMHARIGWQNLRTSEFLDSGEYLLITGTDFKDGAINYSTCHYVEKVRYEQDRHIQISNGSILLTKDGTLGKVAYVQGLSIPATLNAGVFNIEVKDEKTIDKRYLFQYLKAPFLMDYVNRKATGGTIKHLNQNILVDFPVVLPTIKEQVCIAIFFGNLDNLITLHQRKLKHLEDLKKGLLQQMFI